MLREGSKIVACFFLTFLPMYGMERLANYYFLNKDQTFYLISGWRLEVFILSALLGSMAAGALLRDLRLVIATEAAALASFFMATLFACDPRVCYSTAPDGIEPLRFGLFLGSVAIAGGALGIGPREKVTDPKWKVSLVAMASFFAAGYYPVIFTFAGARLLPSVHPWAVATLLFVLALATTMLTAVRVGPISFVVPVAALLLLFLTSFGIALAYIGDLGSEVLVMCITTVAGAAAGVTIRSRRSVLRHGGKPLTSALFGGSIVLVLLMTLIIIPDAVTGVLPGGATVSRTITIGSPSYAGAYEVSPQGHAYGAMVTVSFAGTNASQIQQDNFLAAGFGIHSAGCCVDGIDYAYRFDAYLFHDGKESLVATGWEACDDNAACGGHSWKILLYSLEKAVGNVGQNVTLIMNWIGGRISWSYSVGGGTAVNFTEYSVPSPENHDFNTGVSGGVALGSQKAAYFFQFGLMSRFPLGHGGWRVTLMCPSTLWSLSWTCVGHANALGGEDSYWKVIWRWGEEYPDVSVRSSGTRTMVFEYSPENAMTSFQTIW